MGFSVCSSAMLFWDGKNCLTCKKGWVKELNCKYIGLKTLNCEDIDVCVIMYNV